MLYPDFKRFVSAEGLLREGDRLLVAVSGGVDSMVMMELLSRVARGMDLRARVVHVNHMLRGRESMRDERHVEREARRLGFEFASARARPRAGENLQGSARSLRLRFFRRQAEEFRASRVLLAHNRGDQAETVLMHIVRGAGLAGLAGMSPLSRADGILIARPLLFASRGDIAAYAKRRGVAFREDRTNRTLKYRRNEVRHSLMPALERMNPRIEESLAAMAGRLREDERALDLVARASFNEALASAADGRVLLRAEDFAAMPEVVRARMLMIAWRRATGRASDLNGDQIRRMDSIAASGRRTGEYRLRAPWEFRKRAGLIEISRGRAGRARR
ncbi:MAG: tRNA lysidine(34) synthetase TilS [Proteobacteria bacterium]|nr:tRNA lysidine(34) synthetase TilS [Pseudomonadota bacterium]